MVCCVAGDDKAPTETVGAVFSGLRTDLCAEDPAGGATDPGGETDGEAERGQDKSHTGQYNIVSRVLITFVAKQNIKSIKMFRLHRETTGNS